jgi:hypothetical protein
MVADLRMPVGGMYAAGLGNSAAEGIAGYDAVLELRDGRRRWYSAENTTTPARKGLGEQHVAMRYFNSKAGAAKIQLIR